MGFGMGFGMFSVMFTIMFIVVIGMFVVSAVQGVSRWNKNNNSPRLTVQATVVAKRADISRHHHSGANDHHHSHTSTTYYVTFEVESGDRMELQMDGSDYGLLVEGDQGSLSFQGTRYLGFERG
ncbi:MAG: DUF2500 domain-containing protein [Ruminococcaceae bacterium]|nr:DUF2500 domain-containing protein [Oscillospiraceae bacterium]